VCAGGAENIPMPDPAPVAEFVPTGVGTAYDTVVLTGENKDACCSGGVGYKQQNMSEKEYIQMEMETSKQ